MDMQLNKIPSLALKFSWLYSVNKGKFRVTVECLSNLSSNGPLWHVNMCTESKRKKSFMFSLRFYTRTCLN
jgi:hypothetical protein